MLLEEYTADAICWAMGLPGFVEQAWMQEVDPTLRVVLTPSFHPELCITLAHSSNGALLSTVVLLEQLWAQRSSVHLPHEREQVSISTAVLDEVLGLFAAAHASFDSQKRCVCVDGMGSESCLVSRAGTQKLDSNILSDTAVRQFVARLLHVAWNSCCQLRVRNALAQAARYIEMEFPMQIAPPQPHVTRLAVLGTPEERHDFFKQLRSGTREQHHVSEE
jgi:hypothetical protein